MGTYYLRSIFFESVNAGRQALGKAFVDQFVIRLTGFSALQPKFACQLTAKGRPAHF